MQTKECFLVLQDGSMFPGTPFGDWRDVTGETVFNTSMTGYQEVLTDPSYAEQFIVLTFPLVGNYGMAPDFSESAKIHAAGLVVAEACGKPTHWTQTQNLDSFLREHSTPGLAGVDTRALTRHLRTQGTLPGKFVSHKTAVADAVRELSTFHRSRDLAVQASTPTPYCAKETGTWRVTLVDFGAKASIIRALAALDARISVVPSTSSARDILAQTPDALVLSNGPGDPKDCSQAIATTRALLTHVPIFGICLGQQILALACGGDTYKLKFGHRGGNHPVKDLATGRTVMTAQNHGYAVSSTPGSQFAVTYVNLNDNSVEGIAHRTLPAFAVQFHPESSPGPREAAHLFGKLKAMATTERGLHLA
ncbi:MAG: Carbamoyl-phosphate synthase small chain [Firmicutes bacterium]|nr:Carbamoyl-phosphate synthase small chain [candidate division NPL-UPA2 bacterium]